MDTDGTTLYYGSPDTRHTLQVFPELRDRPSHRMADSLLGVMRQVADEGKFLVKSHFAALLDDTVEAPVRSGV